MRVIGIVGAGTMGRGIAEVCLLAGFDVILMDVSPIAVSSARDAIAGRLRKLVEKAKIQAREEAAAFSRLIVSTTYELIPSADVVIEAATERLELKTNILVSLGELVNPGTIIASNTSSLSITRLARGIACPERFIGMHFFNPVPAMPLVEVVPGAATSSDVCEKIRQLCEKLGKTAVTVRNSPGFVVNRILCPMINEAFFVLGEGVASAKDIDDAMRLGSSHPIGPLALADLIGLDTLLAIMEILHSELGDQKYRPARLLRDLVEAGSLGRKSGQGVYHYT